MSQLVLHLHVGAGAAAVEAGAAGAVVDTEEEKIVSMSTEVTCNETWYTAAPALPPPPGSAVGWCEQRSTCGWIICIRGGEIVAVSYKRNHALVDGG